MNAGDRVKLVKRTFLVDGVFVLTGSLVEIQSIEGDKITVLYNDKEGFPHTIELTPADVAPL